MHTFRHHAAHARCHPLTRSGVAKVEYLGPISESAFFYLACKVLRVTQPVV